MLLHVCCAPCTIYSLAYWREQGEDVQLYYFNPNIHPYAEYQKRLETLKQFVEAESVTHPLVLIIAKEYPLRDFLVSALATEPRCDACYSMRLQRTAEMALELGEKEFSTTLLISPYQQHERIAELGEAVAAQYGLRFRYADLRPGFRGSQNEARDRGYYRQKYCGCVFSELERATSPKRGGKS